MSDFSVETHGSIFLVWPHNAEARAWLVEAHTDGQWFHHSLAVEHRYIRDLVDGMSEAGFTVE